MTRWYARGCNICVLCDSKEEDGESVDYCKWAKKPIETVDPKTGRMSWCPFDEEVKNGS